jgi:hypothetical protein
MTRIVIQPVSTTSDAIVAIRRAVARVPLAKAKKLFRSGRVFTGWSTDRHWLAPARA